MFLAYEVEHLGQREAMPAYKLLVQNSPGSVREEKVPVKDWYSGGRGYSAASVWMKGWSLRVVLPRSFRAVGDLSSEVFRLSKGFSGAFVWIPVNETVPF
jgi:hypothetical protein